MEVTLEIDISVEMVLGVVLGMGGMRSIGEWHPLIHLPLTHAQTQPLSLAQKNLTIASERMRTRLEDEIAAGACDPRRGGWGGWVAAEVRACGRVHQCQLERRVRLRHEALARNHDERDAVAVDDATAERVGVGPRALEEVTLLVLAH